MTAKRCLLVLAVTGLIVLFTSTAHSAIQLEIESLRGLTGVGVVVEPLDNEIKKELPFDEKDIRADVESKLGAAGIKVLSEQEQAETRGEPFLYVNVSIGRIPGESIFCYGIGINFSQGVYLERNRRYLPGTTWENGSIGAVSEDIVSRIRDRIRDRLDRFIDDYLSVNPNGGK